MPITTEVQNILPITTDTDAGIEFDRLCPSTVCPELLVGEVQNILDRHLRGTLWTASTVYELGAVVIPTLANRNGCRYKLVEYTATATNQQSGATEPNWSTSREARVTDNHVIWEEAGSDWGAVLWDFQAAARDGWLLKASKTVGRVNFATAQGISVDAGQLHEHCREMANTFQAYFVL